MLLLCAASASAQDVIVKKDGSTVVCHVVELTATEITYKKWGNLNGSNYVMDRSAASAINYENGKKVNLSEVENLYQPGNQNDGVQQYNDRALLKLDYDIQKNIRKARLLKTMGWIGGALLVGGGLAFNFIAYPNDDDHHVTGYLLAGGGVVWTSAFLTAAYKVSNHKNLISANNVYSQHFNLGNGTSFTASVDMLSVNLTHDHTLGLGLRYNF